MDPFELRDSIAGAGVRGILSTSTQPAAYVNVTNRSGTNATITETGSIRNKAAAIDAITQLELVYAKAESNLEVQVGALRPRPLESADDALSFVRDQGALNATDGHRGVIPRNLVVTSLLYDIPEGSVVGNMEFGSAHSAGAALMDTFAVESRAFVKAQDGTTALRVRDLSGIPQLDDTYALVASDASGTLKYKQLAADAITGTFKGGGDSNLDIPITPAGIVDGFVNANVVFSGNELISLAMAPEATFFTLANTDLQSIRESAGNAVVTFNAFDGSGGVRSFDFRILDGSTYRVWGEGNIVDQVPHAFRQLDEGYAYHANAPVDRSRDYPGYAVRLKNANDHGGEEGSMMTSIQFTGVNAESNTYPVGVLVMDNYVHPAFEMDRTLEAPTGNQAVKSGRFRVRLADDANYMTTAVDFRHRYARMARTLYAGGSTPISATVMAWPRPKELVFTVGDELLSVLRPGHELGIGETTHTVMSVSGTSVLLYTAPAQSPVGLDAVFYSGTGEFAVNYGSVDDHKFNIKPSDRYIILDGNLRVGASHGTYITSRTLSIGGNVRGDDGFSIKNGTSVLNAANVTEVRSSTFRAGHGQDSSNTHLFLNDLSLSSMHAKHGFEMTTPGNLVIDADANLELSGDRAVYIGSGGLLHLASTTLETIVDGNATVDIAGALSSSASSITTMAGGDMSIFVDGQTGLSVHGNISLHSLDNTKVDTSGAMSLSAGGDVSLASNGAMQVSAGSGIVVAAGEAHELSAGGNVAVHSGGSMHATATGAYSVSSIGALDVESTASTLAIRSNGSMSLSTGTSASFHAGSNTSLSTGGDLSVTASNLYVRANGDSYVSVNGAFDANIAGDATANVVGALDVDVRNGLSVDVNGVAELHVQNGPLIMSTSDAFFMDVGGQSATTISGNANVSIGGSSAIASSGSMVLSSGGSIRATGASDAVISVAGGISVDAANVDVHTLSGFSLSSGSDVEVHADQSLQATANGDLRLTSGGMTDMRVDGLMSTAVGGGSVLSVAGSSTTTIGDAANLSIAGHLSMTSASIDADVTGNVLTAIGHNLALSVGDGIDVSTGGAFSLWSNSDVRAESGGDAYVSSGANTYVSVGGSLHTSVASAFELRASSASTTVTNDGNVYYGGNLGIEAFDVHVSALGSHSLEAASIHNVANNAFSTTAASIEFNSKDMMNIDTLGDLYVGAQVANVVVSDHYDAVIGGYYSLVALGNITMSSSGHLAAGSDQSLALSAGSSVDVSSGSDVALTAGGNTALSTGGNMEISSAESMALVSRGATLTTAESISLSAGGNVYLIANDAGGISVGADFALDAANLDLLASANATMSMGGSLIVETGSQVVVHGNGSIQLQAADSFSVDASDVSLEASAGDLVQRSLLATSLSAGSDVAIVSGANTSIGTSDLLSIEAGDANVSVADALVVSARSFELGVDHLRLSTGDSIYVHSDANIHLSALAALSVSSSSVLALVQGDTRLLSDGRFDAFAGTGMILSVGGDADADILGNADVNISGEAHIVSGEGLFVQSGGSASLSVYGATDVSVGGLAVTSNSDMTLVASAGPISLISDSDDGNILLSTSGGIFAYAGDDFTANAGGDVSIDVLGDTSLRTSAYDVRATGNVDISVSQAMHVNVAGRVDTTAAQMHMRSTQVNQPTTISVAGSFNTTVSGASANTFVEGAIDMEARSDITLLASQGSLSIGSGSEMHLSTSSSMDTRVGNSLLVSVAGSTVHSTGTLYQINATDLDINLSANVIIDASSMQASLVNGGLDLSATGSINMSTVEDMHFVAPRGLLVDAIDGVNLGSQSGAGNMVVNNTDGIIVSTDAPNVHIYSTQPDGPSLSFDASGGSILVPHTQRIEVRGPTSTLDIDVNTASFSNDVRVAGDLTVTKNFVIMGSTAQVATNNLVIEDKRLELAVIAPGDVANTSLPVTSMANVAGFSFDANLTVLQTDLSGDVQFPPDDIFTWFRPSSTSNTVFAAYVGGQYDIKSMLTNQEVFVRTPGFQDIANGVIYDSTVSHAAFVDAFSHANGNIALFRTDGVLQPDGKSTNVSNVYLYALHGDHTAQYWDDANGTGMVLHDPAPEISLKLYSDSLANGGGLVLRANRSQGLTWFRAQGSQIVPYWRLTSDVFMMGSAMLHFADEKQESVDHWHIGVDPATGSLQLRYGTRASYLVGAAFDRPVAI